MLQYIVRRLLTAIPTVIAIAIVSFVLVQLPPGDYLSAYVAQMQATGMIYQEEEIEALRQRYGLGEPIYVQFGKWVLGMFRGDFGMSFRYQKPVGELIGERLVLTMVLTFSTLFVTWLLALPIGVYSATHQYSAGDYLMTFVSFVGRGIPEFMLGLILMWIALSQFGVSAAGLFSLGYRNEPWSWGKVVDLLKHLWVPMVVLGTGGTASLIRIMRANLLDELNKPYVESARAKGLKERVLIWRYPVRIALNPFISTIGLTLPNLVSGATIVSVVLSLPTAGPLLLEALMSQDMYLAGAFLLFLGVLTVIGSTISDVLLVLVDPRIRTRT
jgi:peptide/nickel transport system permease protein